MVGRARGGVPGKEAVASKAGGALAAMQGEAAVVAGPTVQQAQSASDDAPTTLRHLLPKASLAVTTPKSPTRWRQRPAAPRPTPAPERTVAVVADTRVATAPPRSLTPAVAAAVAAVGKEL
jgi:hypothetical protein